MDNRNTIIAVVLMVLVWIAFSVLFPPAPPQTTKETPAAAVTSPSTAPAPAVPAPAVNAMSPGAQQPAPPPARDVREIKVETDVYRATFSTLGGGQLTRLELKNFQADLTAGTAAVDLVGGHGDELAANLFIAGEGDFSFPGDTVFSCDEPRSSVRLSGSEQLVLRFQLPRADGTLIMREITLAGQRYAMEQTLRVVNHSPAAKTGRLGVILRESPYASHSDDRTFVGFSTYDGKKVHDDKGTDIDKSEKLYSDGLRWSGYKTKYFFRALLPLDQGASGVQLRKQSGSYESRLLTPPLAVAASQEGVLKFRSYFGPLELEALRAVSPDLESAVDFGFFSFIAKPFFYILKFFFTFVGNYGFAIIILTVLIKLAFWPLTQKSYASMKAMQVLQPEMQKLREKYKNDRDRMNREIMELYQKHRVNPLGGCLPMLVQIPFFFALYQVLMVSIDLRHAPFMLWITDLSVKDPYYVTPLIMGATMFIQQKMSPSQMDPMQQKIFLAMPIVFTFLFLNFPAGLVLYWLVNNLLTILQQYLINKQK